MYIILQELFEKELVKEVNKHLEYGYELVGGPYTNHFDTDIDYNSNNGGLRKFKPRSNVCQAMIKHEKTERQI